jgi:hypothetical protein
MMSTTSSARGARPGTSKRRPFHSTHTLCSLQATLGSGSELRAAVSSSITRASSSSYSVVTRLGQRFST